MKKIFLLIILIIFTNQFSTAQVAVIAHKFVLVNKISDKKLLDFYTGDIQMWEDESPVVVFDLKIKGEVKDVFYDFLSKSPSRMKSIWLKRKLSGEGDPPKLMATEGEMLKNVETTPARLVLLINQKLQTK